MDGLADKFFDAERAAAVLEGKLTDCIMTIMGWDCNDPDTWLAEQVIFDGYDASFELRQCEPSVTITNEQAKQFAALGFQRAWLCELPPGDYDKGRYFSFAPTEVPHD